MKKLIKKSLAFFLLAFFLLIPCRGTAQVSAEGLPAVRQLVPLQNVILVLCEDGTVVSIPVEIDESGWFYEYLVSEQNMEEISQWSEIRELAYCKNLIIGLKADGTVEAVSINEYGISYLEQTASWKNVKKVESGYRYVAGIREDGTVVTAGEEPEGYIEEYSFLDCLADWTDVVKLEIGVCAAGEYAAALRSDGTVAFEGIYDVGWSGPSDHIVDLACSGWMLIAVREDGSVTANGEDSWGASFYLDWKDMKQVDCGDTEAVGLRRDGTVLATSPTREGLLKLTDVERIELEMYSYLAAYRRDGSVWIETYQDDDLQEQTRSWKNVEQISVSMGGTETPFILGLKKDGTVLSAGIDFMTLYREAVGY